MVAVLLIVTSTFAQAPEKMSYQAIIRDSGSSLVSNQAIGIQISILQGSTALYVERQTPTSNGNGLISLEIGTGTIITGNFSSIDWAAATSFIKTEVDPTGSTNYTITGTSELLSVPYAMHTKTAGNGLPLGGLDGQVLKIVNGTAVWSDAENGIAYYRDADGDGSGDNSDEIIVSSGVPSSDYVLDNTDCDDTNDKEKPNQTWYIDTDGDRYGDFSIVQCTRPTNGFLIAELFGTGTDDCDDTDNKEKPNQTWYIDTDGDGYGVSSIVQCLRPANGFLIAELSGTGTDDCDDTDNKERPNQTWYIDADGDRYGGSSIVQCTRPANGYVLTELSGTGTDDCDDTDGNEKPNQKWYEDRDRDGYGVFSVVQCERPSGDRYYVLSELNSLEDCDDFDDELNPSTKWYKDQDRDGYHDSVYINQCENPSSSFYLLSRLSGGGDCDDRDDAINPATIWYTDGDGDGYGVPGIIQCERPSGSFLLSELPGVDCNDLDPAINPAAIEVFGDGIDNNCNDTIDTDAILEIGQFRGGGIVFWVNPVDNKSGLVCAVEDQNNGAGVAWSKFASGFVIGTSFGIGCGSADTQNIFANHGSNNGDFAAGVANSYQGGGYNDWFLPSKQTLNEMYVHKAQINATALVNSGTAFADNCYWSSSEDDVFPDDNAWYQCLDSGNDGNQDKSLTSLVRAVRAFGSANKVTLYRDKDEDFYGNNNEPRDFIICDNNPRGYVSDNSDCNDDDPNINPGGGIDSNCNN